jgi:TolB protein
MKSKLLSLTILLSFVSLLCTNAQQSTEIEVTQFGKGTKKPIPVSMTGFTGEVDKVLRFDLFVAGFEFVSDKPQYVISGGNNGNVQGRVVDPLSQSTLLAKAYSGGNVRSQAHALANDIIFAITKEKGITQTKIAYKMDSRTHSEVYVADYDGHNAVAVTSDKSEVAAPTWIPGQRKLLYCSWKNGATQIFSQDLSSGARSVFNRQPGNSYSPAISADGRRVAMILTKNGSPDLYVCDINGGGLTQLTKTRDDESSPTWSPDGSSICYVSRSGTRAALFSISANGGEPRRLTVSGSLNLTEPDWSPDGKYIVFTRQMGGFEVCVVPAKGGEGQPLCSGEDPSWAPNSRTVIFTRRQNNKRVLSLLDVPTKRVKDVAQISGSCSQPSWSR